MGYYSIFKIIRQILKDLFSYKVFRKIIFIILLAIVTVFLLHSFGYCASNNPYYYYIPNEPSRYFDFTPLKDYYFLFGCYRESYNVYSFNIIFSDKPFTIATRPNNSTYAYTNANGGLWNSSGGSAPYSYISDIINTWKPTSTSVPQVGDFSFYNKGVTTSEPQYYFCNFDILNTTTNKIIFSNKVTRYPTLDNSTEELQNLSFNNFNVSLNDYSNQDVYMLFYNRSLSNSQNTNGLYPISEKLLAPESIYYDSKNSTSNNAKYTIPIWKTGILFNIGSTYEIRFATLDYNPDYDTTTYNYIGDTYQFTISSNVTQDYINQLNQQTATDTSQDNFNNINNSINKQSDAINNQTNAINNQTQSIDNINNSINDSAVDDSSIDLPTDNTQDPTQNGVDNIFQTIYNSFTSGTAQDIVFPIPFTNKSITLQANYLYNVLQNNNASWIIMIIQAFWWYLISRFIIRDIMKKIRKIKQGNFDNIQNDNIKEDML